MVDVPRWMLFLSGEELLIIPVGAVGGLDMICLSQQTTTASFTAVCRAPLSKEIGLAL